MVSVYYTVHASLSINPSAFHSWLLLRMAPPQQIGSLRGSRGATEQEWRSGTPRRPHGGRGSVPAFRNSSSIQIHPTRPRRSSHRFPSVGGCFRNSLTARSASEFPMAILSLVLLIPRVAATQLRSVTGRRAHAWNGLPPFCSGTLAGARGATSLLPEFADPRGRFSTGRSFGVVVR